MTIQDIKNKLLDSHPYDPPQGISDHRIPRKNHVTNTLANSDRSLTRGNACGLVDIEIRFGGGALAYIWVIGVVKVGCRSGDARMGLLGDRGWRMEDRGWGAVGVGAWWVLTWG